MYSGHTFSIPLPICTYTFSATILLLYVQPLSYYPPHLFTCLFPPSLTCLLYRWSSATTDSERGGEYGRVLQLCLGGPHCHQCMVGTQPPGNSTYTAVCVCVSVNVLDCKWGHVFYKPLPGIEDSSVRRVSHYW